MSVYVVVMLMAARLGFMWRTALPRPHNAKVSVAHVQKKDKCFASTIQSQVQGTYGT